MLSHKIDVKAVWPRNGHAASVGVKQDGRFSAWLGSSGLIQKIFDLLLNLTLSVVISESEVRNFCRKNFVSIDHRISWCLTITFQSHVPIHVCIKNFTYLKKYLIHECKHGNCDQNLSFWTFWENDTITKKLTLSISKILHKMKMTLSKRIA